MLLIVLRHGQHCEVMAKLFGMNGSTSERLPARLLNAVSEHAYRICLQRTGKNRTS